jgi:hypothetical protein
VILRLFLSGTVLLAASVVTPLAFADELDPSRVPNEASLASVADASGVAPVPERGGPAQSLGIDLRIDSNGFRLGGRLSGSKGVSEAWLNGQVRGDGVTLGGQLKGHDGPARDFKLNLDLLPGWARTAARIWLMLP